MGITILSDETIIGLIIASSKELLNNPPYSGAYTVLTAFEATIVWLYNLSVRASASSFYRNTRRSIEHDPVFIEELLTVEAERTEAIRRNEKETEAIRKILRHQPVVSRIDKIRPLLTYAKNHGGIDALTYVSLFNYGYILGKRAERAKRKVGVAL